MWCGVDAVARVTGWTRDQVWLHMRWHRERKGATIPDVPRGGTDRDEQWSALYRAGFMATGAWEGPRRMTYDDFRRQYGRKGVWIVLQSRHLAVHDARNPWPAGRREWDTRSRQYVVREVRYNRIIKAWRIERRTDGTDPILGMIPW